MLPSGESAHCSIPAVLIPVCWTLCTPQTADWANMALGHRQSKGINCRHIPSLRPVACRFQLHCSWGLRLSLQLSPEKERDPEVGLSECHQSKRTADVQFPESLFLSTRVGS